MDKSSVSVTATATEKPYHAKRPHRKTRTGCRNCKTRKVKCDEGRPTCRACTVRNERCVYTAVPKRPPASAPASSPASPASPSTEAAQTLALVGGANSVPQQPLFTLAGHDELDMRLLWFYTTATYASFSTGRLKQRSVDILLKVNVVQHAFANPFLMDTLLGLSAMHVNHLSLHGMGVSRSREIQYRAKAFETYRRAVEAADPATYPALLVSSLLLCGLSTHMFRGEEARPLSILDWMVIWKGISTIADVIQYPRGPRSGMEALITRPELDLDASARCIPSYLLFMIASIREGDPDFPLVQSYYKALQILGSLYLGLRGGFDQLFLLRIATFFTFLPQGFVDAARERRPRALIVLAHYLVFATFRVKWCWWMDGISESEIPNICRAVGPEWQHLLRVPKAALLLDAPRDIARLLLEDPSWDKATSVEDEALTSSDESELVIRAAREDGSTAKQAEP